MRLGGAHHVHDWEHASLAIVCLLGKQSPDIALSVKHSGRTAVIISRETPNSAETRAFLRGFGYVFCLTCTCAL